MEATRLVPREELAESEWDTERKDWRRPPVDREVLKKLTERSTLNGILRILYFALLLSGAAVATVLVARINLWLAIPVLYVYYFLYGFVVAIAHELQHGTVFAARERWLSTIVHHFVQALLWNSGTYAVVSHRLHHRYTMVRGYDPETDWPEVITSKWLRRFFLRLVLRILVVGAPHELYHDVKRQVDRIVGKKDWMMRDHCTDKQVAAIRRESAMILAFHIAIATAAVVFQIWGLLAFITFAWQIGRPFEQFWHATKHIARPYNVNDHRLNTRSVRVSWFIKLIFWGLDDHVDHHLYPAVPSRNLPRLHRILEKDLPDPDTMFGCWVEMFEISKVKDTQPRTEYAAVRRSSEADASVTPG